jgi:hypothetical protein
MRIYAAYYVCSKRHGPGLDVDPGQELNCFCRVLSSIFSCPARGAAKKEGLPI